MRQLGFGKAAERETARQTRVHALVFQGDWVAHRENERQRFLLKFCHAEVERQRAGQLIAHGETEGLAVYLHADAFCHKCHAVAKLAGQRQLIECLRQPSDGIFALLRGRAVNGNALGFHADAALDRRDGYLVRRDFGSRVRRTFQLRRRIRGRDVGGGTALELCQAVIAGLVQLSAVSAVENALFAVDDRVFAVRREAVHRQFAAMRNVP